ncbi:MULTISPECIES: exodeoxyribonuclease VII large subunit [unclassified Arthrobacter]|uniref:exodeoxyribonuclease VII large subunit n=1 Tax=unclassified Arthrobacter TaxID=235627 RepID=UPI001D13DDD8|nr:MULTISPECIES: exodeoxyribonuclease VII large subunit [unclassified Arthrobacter]MCC3290355.1 exodeoxyribonuclease VII large subunit [Arthrobacter sp. zg-Y1110]MCC3300134.1 exodeoxyribonuclease VII large subunit [Arthrobacter sp. zg-Y895]UWX84271.1 exodeoxyribonuclease VII large subunit [Arthrobacter sp. zg-Y1110]
MQDDSGPLSPENTPEQSTLPATAAQTTPENPWPLALLSKNLKSYIDRAPATWVEGQVIELNRRANASYITLRDVDAEVSLSLTAWSTVMNRLELPLERGARVVALVKPDFWVKTGRLSMQTRDIRPVGLGDLLARIERLRHALAAEGLFREDRKLPLPLLPGRIGLITGRNSDAMKDVMRNAALRWPAVEFEVREVAVQGVNAVAEVSRALAELDAMPEVDVIIIARGGGSLEDLLAFSHEDLVRAVSAASTPVVSAIGHEADRPLLDDVADLRASTPTDAAKRVVPDVGEELARIRQSRQQLRRVLNTLVGRETDRLNHIRSRPALAAPQSMVERRQEEISRLRSRAMSAVTAEVRRDADRIGHLRAQVRALSPQNTLDRGYAVVQLQDGSVVRDAGTVPAAAQLRIRVAVGELTATEGTR